MKAASEAECLAAYERVSVGIDEALKKILEQKAKGPAAPMYQMLSYFMGFLDENFQPLLSSKGGKRFRPSLCLFLAESYGKREAAFDAALAVELFHNFTLIHDDVEDRDEVRRNRPTVWKLWGINHAINSGDAQSLILSELCVRAGMPLGQKLLEAFEEVLEGQYLDFELTDKSLRDAVVTKENALAVTAKKTGVLIAIACEAAGIANKQSEEECKRLYAYGMALGMVFQLADDFRSIWLTQAETGKDSHSDIREHKRTLPFFVARETLVAADKKRLEDLYDLPRQLNETEIREVLSLMEKTNAKERMIDTINSYADEARKHVEALSLDDKDKSILLGIVDMLSL